MADNEKAAGIPIEDDALDKVAGGVEITRELLDGLHKVDIPNNNTQPLYNFEEACESIKSTLDRQNNPNNYYTEPSAGDNMIYEDRLNENFKNYLENLNRR